MVQYISCFPDAITWVSPIFKVSVSATEPQLWINNAGGAGGATFRFSDTASSSDWKYKITATGDFKIRDQAGALDVMCFQKATGYIGMGTLLPTSKLVIVGLPISPVGLMAGAVWVDTTGGLNILKIV